MHIGGLVQTSVGASLAWAVLTNSIFFTRDGLVMCVIFLYLIFYNIIIISAKVDRGGGGG